MNGKADWGAPTALYMPLSLPASTYPNVHGVPNSLDVAGSTMDSDGIGSCSSSCTQHFDPDMLPPPAARRHRRIVQSANASKVPLSSIAIDILRMNSNVVSRGCMSGRPAGGVSVTVHQVNAVTSC